MDTQFWSPFIMTLKQKCRNFQVARQVVPTAKIYIHILFFFFLKFSKRPCGLEKGGQEQALVLSPTPESHSIETTSWLTSEHPNPVLPLPCENGIFSKWESSKAELLRDTHGILHGGGSSLRQDYSRYKPRLIWKLEQLFQNKSM